jgi:N-methylhydantoinase A
MQYVLGIDIGGTCTDSVVVDSEGNVTLGKHFSTPPDFSEGIFNSLTVATDSLGISLRELLVDTRLFLHSTTVAENAVVNGTLARAGLIVNEGFEDTLFAMRGGYGRWSGLTEEEKRNPIQTEKPPPIVARDDIRGIAQRSDVNGTVLWSADVRDVESAVQSLLDKGVESIGVSLLWSFVEPETEQMVKAVVSRLRPDIFTTISHEIAPIVGEYERTSTVALNARLGPVVQRYVDNLRASLRELGFTGNLLVMQAYGGLLPVEKAVASPVGMIESGPVSGLVGSKQLGEAIGFQNIIAADMGGTTFKVGVVREGLIEYQRESMVLRYHYALPKMDVISLGLAGGSIITVDPRTGVPRIGPNSAGSFPGPVCYDHGGAEPTVTDVDAVLGYLNPKYFLGGSTSLNIEKARQVFAEKVARPLGMSEIDAAAAMFKLANSMIYDLLHKATVQRGLDPRQFALFSFGGTAGMHAAIYGEELGVQKIVVPHSASVHGAYGLITSDIVHEDQTTHPFRMPVDLAVLNDIFGRLESRVREQLAQEGFGPAEVVVQRSVDMRYRRQVHIVTVPVVGSNPTLTSVDLDATVALFERLYQEKYGAESAYREAGIELVSFRVRASGLQRRPSFRTYELGTADPSAALVEHRAAWVAKNAAMEEVPGYDFARLKPGNIIPGPAIIWTPITTAVVAAGQTATIDEYKNLLIGWNQ